MPAHLSPADPPTFLAYHPGDGRPVVELCNELLSRGARKGGLDGCEEYAVQLLDVMLLQLLGGVKPVLFIVTYRVGLN